MSQEIMVIGLDLAKNVFQIHVTWKPRKTLTLEGQI